MNLSADHLIELLLASAAIACIAPGLRDLLRGGHRVRGGALVGLGVLVAATLYGFATFTIKLF